MPSLLVLCCGLSVSLGGGAPGDSPALGPADSARALSDAHSAVRLYVRRVDARNHMELRHDLIERLDELAREIPGDDWIVGHRVGLRIKQGWPTDAVTTALGCEGSAWWCRALAGFALHVEGSFAEAEAALDEALAGMPEELRCAWGAELLHVLDGDLHGRYARADCQERQRLEARLWWLADPLHTLAGNDRKTEHYARVIGMRLHHQILAITTGRPCADPHHLGVIRGGWPQLWWSELSGLEAGGPGSRFIPSGDVAVQPLESAPLDWVVPAGTTSERYGPLYGPVSAMDQQTAFFARGDSILVVAAASVGRARAGGLALTRNEHEPPVVVEPEMGFSRFRARVPRDEYLVSIEALRAPEGAGRARFGHRLPDPSPTGLAVSDILLFSWSDSVEETLEAVAPWMLASPRFPRSRIVGLFWEVYGAEDSETLEVSLSVQPVDPGLLRRLGESLRLATPRDVAAVRWRESGEEPGVLRTHFRLDLANLSPGRYVLKLEVSDGAGEPVVARREIDVTDG